MRGSAALLIKPVMMRAKEPPGLKELLTPLLSPRLPALRRPTHHHHLHRRLPPHDTPHSVPVFLPNGSQGRVNGGDSLKITISLPIGFPLPLPRCPHQM